jgi:hypothetical protein
VEEPTGIDYGSIRQALWRPLLYWLLAVGGATAAGYPGVVCITPMAWLLAVPVGRDCVLYTRQALTSAPVREAALAGAALGLAEGMLMFLVLALRMTASGEWPATLAISSLVGGVGAVVCALIAIAMSVLYWRASQRNLHRDE